ncbi:MAG: cobyric acid synthase [Epsilonproteobacteria bacterium]|nr:cobyric acid synthase [Campylobacterota bacterium]
MHSLSIFGTSSDAGKSTLSFAIAYLLQQYGIKIAPFKAQNVSNNSMVTDIGSGEIAIPQAFCAEALGLETTPLFNPVLLKSGGTSKAHIIINGKSIANTSVKEYYRNLDKLKPIVKEAFETLQQNFECIVAEGAGSPVELNLMQKDLSNLYIAKEFGTKIILVADIERGGVFASIYGVYNLLPKGLQKNVIGVLVNKFRGDISLFDEGVRIIEERFAIPVLGVIPYKPFNLGFEDSASLANYRQNKPSPIIKVGVIHLPHISNFTDFEPLVADEEIVLDFITTPTQATNYDLLIVPGSKMVVADLLWLKEQGFGKILQDKKRHIIAICGGYEMMFETIKDPHHIESNTTHIEGFGRFKGEVVFQKEKIVKKGLYNLFGVVGSGYEIHNATAKKNAKRKKRLLGTFIHGIFDNDNFRQMVFRAINPNYRGYNFQTYKKNSIEDFTQHIAKHLNIQRVIDALHN